MLAVVWGQEQGAVIFKCLGAGIRGQAAVDPVTVQAMLQAHAARWAAEQSTPGPAQPNLA